MMIIDPPSVFDTTKDWTGFLSRMKRQLEADPDNVDLKAAVAEAEAELASREAA